MSAPLNNVRDNLSNTQRNAIQNLVELRNQGSIVIQPLDKTGGLAIFDRADYVAGINDILKDQIKTPNGEIVSYNEQTSQDNLVDGMDRIREAVHQGLQYNYVTKVEANAMVPKGANAGRLYGLAKDHKKFDKVPPFRPIVS